MPNPSPLRYPGGKHRLAGFIQLAIQNLNMPDCTYVEPFAGGAGVALSLLLDGTVNRIVINDYDKAIYSFWRAVRQELSQIAKMYSDYEMRHFDLTYSAANKGTASELMIFSDIASCPTQRQLDDNRIKINLRV